MLPWKLRKSHILPVNQNLSSVYFSLAAFQLVSCNPSLAMIWIMTYTHKPPKLCSATWSVNQPHPLPQLMNTYLGLDYSGYRKYHSNNCFIMHCLHSTVYNTMMITLNHNSLIAMWWWEMSKRQGRKLQDDMKESVNNLFQQWKKKPNKSGKTTCLESLLWLW